MSVSWNAARALAMSTASRSSSAGGARSNTCVYAQDRSACWRTRRASGATLDPISRGSTIARRLAIHRLSLEPPQPNQRCNGRLTSVCVLRTPGASACAVARPSVQARPG
jgi:hypothetical protein